MSVKSIREFTIPNTYSIENAVLGCLIDNSHFMRDAERVLNDDSFADNKNRELWSAMRGMYARGEQIAEYTLIGKTDIQHLTSNIIPQCRGTEAMSEVYRKLDALHQASLKRRAYFTGLQILQASSGEQSVEEIAGMADEYTKAVNAVAKVDEVVSVADAVNQFAEILEHREAMAKEGKPLRVKTSFPALDFVTFGGFARGNLVILAARPSVGKTAIMLQMARTATMTDTPALVFSLEMTNAELVQRMVSASNELPPYKLAKGEIDWQAFNDATGKFVHLPLYFDDTCGTLDDIMNKIATSAKQGRCGIAFIDYLGLISFRDSNKSTYQQITEATKRLKRLAKDCRIPIVLLCQLNRDMSKEGREPQLHDLRDSGSIEQDADIVLMLDREITTDEDNGHRVRMFIRKNRQGQAGGRIDLEADEFFCNFTQVGTN